jgi:hypothetical protein
MNPRTLHQSTIGDYKRVRAVRGGNLTNFSMHFAGNAVLKTTCNRGNGAEFDRLGRRVVRCCEREKPAVLRTRLTRSRRRLALGSGISASRRFPHLRRRPFTHESETPSRPAYYLNQSAPTSLGCSRPPAHLIIIITLSFSKAAERNGERGRNSKQRAMPSPR